MSRQLTTEVLLTHPEVMAVTKATPVQRAWCRAFDGLPVAELSDRPDVVASFGGPEAVAALPVGTPPVECHAFASSRSAKTMLGAANLVATLPNVDVSGCSAGDIVRVTVSALKLEGTRPLMSHLASMLRKPLLRPLLVEEPTDACIIVRHPSGRPIEIVPTPIDRAGGSALSVWLAYAIVDEEPRQIGAEDGVKNWTEFYRAAIPRILPGGKFLGIGTPHAPFGPAFTLFKERFGKPSSDCIVVRAGGPALNPSWWTPERCEALRRRDPQAYQSDVLAEFRSVDASAFPLDAIEDAIGARVPEQGTAGAPIIAIDLSAMKHDATAIGVFRWVFPSTTVTPYLEEERTTYDHRGVASTYRYPVYDSEGRQVPNPDAGKRLPPMLQCVHLEGFEPGDPSRDGPVTGEDVADRVAAVARDYGARFVAADQFEELSFPALLRDRAPGLQYQAFRWSGGVSGSKTPAVDRLRSLLVARQLLFPNHPRLREELIRFRRVVTQGGEKFEAAPGSTHGDYVSTAITAIMADLAGFIPSSPTRGGGAGFSQYDPYGSNE